MDIRIASQNEYRQLVELDHHISAEMLAHKIDEGEIIVAIENTSIIGWLRYGYFWDSIPFMNILTVIEEYRWKGIGTQLTTYFAFSQRTARNHITQDNYLKCKAFDFLLQSVF
jgi:hypothetical protein